MTPERYKEVGRLYRAALELAPPRWADYLADACGGDEALRQEAESLLAYEARGERLIDQPAMEAAAKAMAEDQAVPEAPSLIGQSIGHYGILSLLGKGGMGEVWLAEDIHLGRKVAVKLLPAEFTADADRLRRFAQEAHAASALNHPNILTIHDIGVAEGTHYIVTEYVAGETLRQRLTGAPEQRIKLAEAIELAAQVAAALAAAHEAGITHRDIKPENVMLRNDGIVKVLDFGLAKLLGKDEGGRMKDEPSIDSPLHPSSLILHPSTIPGAVMGTPRYMSPEQARGELVDARTDIFSLGVMLYEIIAGRAPFAGATTSEVIAALLRDAPPPLTEYAPDVPPEMGRILSRSLHKDRDERYQTVKELLLDLKDLTEDRAFEARLERSAPLDNHPTNDWTLPPPPVEPRSNESAVKPWQRKSAWGMTAVLLLAVVAAWRVWPSRQTVAPHAIKVARLTNGGYITNAVLAPDGKFFAYTVQDGEVAHLWLRQVAGGPPLSLVPELKGLLLGLTFAPDGQAVYFVTYERDTPLGALYRVPTLGGPLTKVLMGIVSPVTFAPDGLHLAFIRLDSAGEATSLVITDLTGGNERIVLTQSGPELLLANGPSWSPDGKQIACQLERGQTLTNVAVCRVVGVDVASGAQRSLTTQMWDSCARLVWLRDGSGLVMVGTKQGESGTGARDAVWFITQPDGTIRRITTDLSRHFYRSLSVSDDGQAMLVIPFNRSSQIWSVAARGSGAKLSYAASSAVQLTTGTGEGRGGIVSLDDGSLVYAARTGEHVDLWQMRNASSPPQQLTTDPPFLEEVSAPSDGRYLVFAAKRGGFSHLFRVNRNGTNLQQVTSGERQEIDSDCSPDGRWIVYASQAVEPGKSAEFKLWKIPAEGGVPVSLTTDHNARTPHFSPDGQWVSYVYHDTLGRWHAVVIPATGGALVKTFALPLTVESGIGCRWTPDGQALTFLVKGKAFDNLWLQPLTGSAPRPLTDFNSGEIYNYTFSRDGQQLFLARGYSIRDVLLIQEFR